jgi:hypothetical protein
MKRHTMKKLVLAVAFTLALTLGVGMVSEQFGLPIATPVYACPSSNGGGC